MVTLWVFCIAALVILHLKSRYQSTGVAILPSNLHVILEFILQTLLPIFLIQGTMDHPMFNLGFGIFTLGLCCFFLFYYFTNAFLEKGIQIQIKNDLQKWLNLDPYTKKASLILLILGIGFVSLVFGATGVIPLLEENTKDSRFFFFDPRYFKYYKYPYWAGISMISFAGFSSFVFALKEQKWASFLTTFAIASIWLALTVHRAPLFGLCIALYALYYQLHPKKMSFLKLFFHIGVAFFGAMILLFLREGSGDMSAWVLSSLESGSSFVDFYEFLEALEIFADQTLVMGKHYLADLFGWVPEGIWDFRDQWRWKEWTKTLFHVPSESGGFRLTMFGQPYFNFGWYGVCIQAALGGIGFCVLDNLAITIKDLYTKKESFSVSRFIFKHTLYFSVVSIIWNFYNFLFYFAAIIAVILWIFLGSIIRWIMVIAQRKLPISPAFEID